MARPKGSTNTQASNVSKAQLRKFVHPLTGKINVSKAAKAYDISYNKIREAAIGFGFIVGGRGKIIPKEKLLPFVGPDGRLNVDAAKRGLSVHTRQILQSAREHKIKRRSPGRDKGVKNPPKLSLYLPRKIIDNHIRDNGTLNLRAAARALSEAGYPISHESMGKYALKMGYKVHRKPRKKSRKK